MVYAVQLLDKKKKIRILFLPGVKLHLKIAIQKAAIAGVRGEIKVFEFAYVHTHYKNHTLLACIIKFKLFLFPYSILSLFTIFHYTCIYVIMHASCNSILIKLLANEISNSHR